MYTMKINEVICFFPKDTCQVAGDISPNILKQTADLPLRINLTIPAASSPSTLTRWTSARWWKPSAPDHGEANEGTRGKMF